MSVIPLYLSHVNTTYHKQMIWNIMQELMYSAWRRQLDCAILNVEYTNIVHALCRVDWNLDGSFVIWIKNWRSVVTVTPNLKVTL
jgi:hypothetical protein